MEQRFLQPELDDLPDVLPVFPLNQVLLLPRGQLPLNIFEPRYLAMVDEALGSHRMIGMIQPKGVTGETGADDVPLHPIGCAGRISAFEQTDDGRYVVTLTGICRFRVVKEMPMDREFRQVKPAWAGFENDLRPTQCLDVDKVKLTSLLKDYFDQEGLSCSWESVKNAPDEKLITCLAMICPFGALEKQALLESRGCQDRAHLFMQLLEMALQIGETNPDGSVSCH